MLKTLYFFHLKLNKMKVKIIESIEAEHLQGLIYDYLATLKSHQIVKDIKYQVVVNGAYHKYSVMILIN